MLSLNGCKTKNCVNLTENEAPKLAVHWLENEAVAGFRVWQIMFLCFAGILAVVIILCCCVRFRIPRTKQEIEADYIRKKITKKFQKQLKSIQNSDMDEMDLKRALDRIRAEFKSDTESLAQSEALSEATLGSENYARSAGDLTGKSGVCSDVTKENDSGLSLTDMIEKRKSKTKFSTLVAMITKFRTPSKPLEVMD